MAKRIPYAIAQAPYQNLWDGYVAAPIYAFDPIRPGQRDETYPLLKNFGVIAIGTKTECMQGVRIIKREQRATQKPVELRRVFQLLEELADGPKARDFSLCHRCYGEGAVYVERMKITCPLCGGSGRGMR